MNFKFLALLQGILIVFSYSSCDESNLSFPQFDDAMLCKSSQKSAYEKIISSANKKERDFLNYARVNYQRYFLNAEAYSDQPRIPKIIHQIWLSYDKPAPAELEIFQKKLKELHPDWEYRLWTYKELENFELVNKKQFYAETHQRSRANILRCEILRQYGGVYLDLDIEMFKPLDYLHHCCDFYTGFVELTRQNKWGHSFRCNNAVIAAIPNHPIIENLVYNLKDYRHISGNLNMQIFKRTGVEYFNTILHTCFVDAEGANLILPGNFFYPWIFYPKEGKNQLCISNETLLVHWYHTNNLLQNHSK